MIKDFIKVNMKRLLSIFVIAVLFVVLAGCEKPEEKAEQKAEDRYYVKYEVDVSSMYSGDGTYITVNTEKGAQLFKTGKKFSETFGPVSRNFIARMVVYTEYSATVYLRIYACRDKEPFVLKKTEAVSNPSKENPVVATYTIDF